MAYVNPNFVNGSSPALDAENLNDLAGALELVSVENGGTGVNKVTQGALLVGAGTNPMSEVSGTGALYAVDATNPQFGTLPINCGGTGAVTPEGIRANLGLAKSGFVIAETAPTATNSLWIDTGNGGILKYYDGTQWTPVVAVFG